MKITLLFTGKTREKYIETGIKEYSGRLRHYIPLEIIVLPDIKSTRGLSQNEHMEKEGALILKRIPDRARVILLDERGRKPDSIQMAEYFEKKSLEGADLCFIIGGPYGFSEAVYSRADDKISLSNLTFSHQMVRLIFLEQLYRSFTIIKGLPYHHS